MSANLPSKSLLSNYTQLDPVELECMLVASSSASASISLLYLLQPVQQVTTLHHTCTIHSVHQYNDSSEHNFSLQAHDINV